MAQVTVTIAGKTYRMACGEGEEAHLEGLAAAFDGKIDEMRGSFGEIGDMRLHVMAALTIADELAETKKRMGALEVELAALREVSAAGEERTQATQSELAEALIQAAERVERLARTMTLPTGTPPPT
jgi:cell division protein ZapA